MLLRPASRGSCAPGLVHTPGLFEQLGRHANEVGHSSLLFMEFAIYKELVEHVLFEWASYGSQTSILDYLKKVLVPDAFKAFLHNSIFD